MRCLPAIDKSERLRTVGAPSGVAAPVGVVLPKQTMYCWRFSTALARALRICISTLS